MKTKIVLSLFLSYIISWTASYFVLNGPDPSYYFSDWIYAIQGGGERPMFTLFFSLILFVPLAFLAAFWLYRRSKQKGRHSYDPA